MKKIMKNLLQVNQVNYEKGIDVSKWQVNVNWNEIIKDGVKHAFIKMTEGGTYTDPKFVDNWNAPKNAGLNVGAYHYFRGTSSTPEAQAENIKKNLKSISFDTKKDLFAIDVKKSGNELASSDDMADNLQNLLTRIKRDILKNFKLIIYCSPDYWDNGVNWQKYNFSKYGLWVANWNVKNPRLPESWKKAGTNWLW
jgi:lysozyme